MTTANLEQRIRDTFLASAALKQRLAQTLPLNIARAAEVCITALRQGRKLLACGNGGSAADSQHFVAELVGRFEMERAPLPAVALTTDTSILTAIGNDYAYDEVFERQVRALGQPGDVLLALSTSGNSGNVLRAAQAAQRQGMPVLALTGRQGGKLAALLSGADVSLHVDESRTARIQEVHILILHCLADAIEQQLHNQAKP